jgi:NADH dehydrogenase
MNANVNIPNTSIPRVLIVGGGFAGIELAKGLRHAPVQVVMIDKNNYHAFQPLLYQVATAALEPDSIAYPFREIFKKQKNFHFRMAEVLKVRPLDHCVETSIGEITYDYLVLAVGAKTNYFGMADFQQRAMPMKTIPEALTLRTQILENFEKALLVTNLEDRQALMNIIIVGGGSTGVEMAGALGELRKIILPHDYPELDFTLMQIHIIDKEDRLLKTMSQEASRSAEQFLRKFELHLWLNTSVVDYDGRTLGLSNGRKILANTVIWSAGVTGALIDGLSPESTAGGRIKVDELNRVAGHENIFAIGDVAGMVSPKYAKGHPMLAPVAIQQAKNLAGNIQRHFKKEKRQPFVYQNPGIMATVGRNNAVVDLSFIRFQGVLAWFTWVFVHLLTLVGFRNKLVALVNWIWNYFSYDRGLRLIIKPYKKN